jgi:hypothetical protein
MTNESSTKSRDWSKILLILLAIVTVIYGILTGIIPTAMVSRAKAVTAVPICQICPGGPSFGKTTVITDPALIGSATPASTVQAIVNSGTMSQAMATRLLQVGAPYEDYTETIEIPPVPTILASLASTAVESQTLAGAGGNALYFSLPEGTTYESSATVRSARLATQRIVWHHSIVSGNSTAGCGGTIQHTKRVKIFVSVTIGWRKAIQAGWCWNSARITVIGKHYRDQWAAGGYCFNNVVFQNIGWVGGPGNWREFQLYNKGSLHISVPKVSCGTVPFDNYRNIVPRIYYHRGGGYNYGTKP